MLFRVVFSLVYLAVATAAAPYSSLYFFGDSLTDTGKRAEGYIDTE